MPKKPKKSLAITVDHKPSAETHTIDTVATLKDLRKATHHTQDGLAAAMGVGQGTISRIEKRDDMLVSTLQHYVEGVGGALQIVVTFPNRASLVVERLGKRTTSSKDANTKPAAPNGQASN